MMTTIIALGLAFAGINNDLQTTVAAQPAIHSPNVFAIDPATCFDDPGFSKRLMHSRAFDFAPMGGTSPTVIG